MRFSGAFLAVLAALLMLRVAEADVGDPQIRTDHPWYAGELSCSTFQRLEKTQAELYQRVVGEIPETDEQKAIAAWLWRNTHYWHAEEGVEDLWGKGFRQGGDSTTREYWTGLFAHGFGLCGTTHAQWSAELHALLGHNRGRTVGTAGHNSFEVFLQGGPYGNGRWALLDHDISTIIFDRQQNRLLSIADVQRDYQRLAKRTSSADKQRGWLICGLHPDDGAVYAQYTTVEYFPGYSGPPPMVHLRRGESLRRYCEPGLDDGKTFVFWGRNYNTAGIPGPERSRTWVNQPEKMYLSQDGAGHHPGQARFANAVYAYEPDFGSGDYREGVVDEDAKQITFNFQTPYIIAATPPNDTAWGIYDAGCRNGLVVQGKAGCEVEISTDRGETWTACGLLKESMDLTDLAKGRHQYLLRFSLPNTASANIPSASITESLADAGLKIITVCQANASTIPRLRDRGTEIEFLASGRAVMSVGPNLPQARTHRVAGNFGTPTVTLAAQPPRSRPTVAIHAAAHVASSNPPSHDVQYHIDYSTDAGASWHELVKDWRITRRGDEPADFWSQSFCWGDVQLDQPVSGPLQVRFRNTGGKNYLRAEIHLVYEPPSQDATEVTFAWNDESGEHVASHIFTSATGESQSWKLPTGQNTQTRWVEYRPQSKSTATR